MFVKDIIDIIETLAPKALAEAWDNVGLLVGEETAKVDKILFALDATDDVIEQAVKLDADMIITHHPIIFKGISAVTDQNANGRRIIKLIKNNIAVYSAHTNLDIADGGTNDILAKLVGLTNIEGLVATANGFLGRVGELEKRMSLADFVNKIKNVTHSPYLNVTGGDMSESVTKVGLCTGSGADRDFMLQAKALNCDVYITGDVSYHNAQFAEDIGLCLIDATHYFIETVAMPVVCDYVKSHCGNSVECIVSDVNGASWKQF